MMKFMCIMLLFCLFSCGQQSSPDGRSRLRDAAIQLQIDSMKRQNIALLDSIANINRKLNAIKR
jgi:hypothetical protein